MNTGRLLILLLLMGALLVLPRALAQEDGEASQGPAVAEQAAPRDAGDEVDAASADDDHEAMTSGEAILRKLVQGGTTMLLLALVSIAGVGYAIERFVNLRKSRIVPDGLAAEAARLWQAGNPDAVIALGRSNPSTLGRMLSAIATYRHASATDVNTITGDLAARDLRRHLQRAYPLAVVATISPLLGLLGTVIGMIGAFDQVAIMGELANPAAFGGDIAKALITTGAGLSIAIPALALYHFFKSKINVFGVDLEEEVSELITAWFVAKAVTPAGVSATPAAPTSATSPPNPTPPAKPEAHDAH